MADKQQNKEHRRTKTKTERPAGSQNPKAFSFAKPGKYVRNAGRSSDVKEKRLHVPLVDRLPEEAPPLIVGVVGPPGVGKTTLIKSLIRRYTKQSLSTPQGPITVVTGKRRRLTFMECPSDSLASMVDIAKIVDIVLLLIDGNYGFEMETMEFLNVLSSSGMPGNVFGILTHLDLFKKQDTLRTRKKQLKHRFWSELYQGAKLFYLSGVVNGRYPDREVLNISRFLSVMKNPRPLVWRNSHPYALADRYLDITPPTNIEADPKCDRTIALYGYLRGTNFPAQGAKVHVPGVGDLDVSHVEGLPDPCPTPFQEQEVAKATGRQKPRRLGEKQKILFAPMSDVGGVTVDKDAVYIDVKQPTFNAEDGEVESRGFGEQMMIGLQGERRLLGQDDSMRLFSGSTAIKNSAPRERRPAGASRHPEGEEVLSDEDEAYVSGSNDGEYLSDDNEEADNRPVNGVAKLGFEDEDNDEEDGGVAFADSDSDIGPLSEADEEDFADENEEIDDEDLDDEDLLDDQTNGDLRWKENLAAKARALHTNRRPRQTKVLSRLMYDLTITPEDAIRQWRGESDDSASEADEDAGDDENFFKMRPVDEKKKANEDRVYPRYDNDRLAQKWSDENRLSSLRSRFISQSRGPREDGEGDGDMDEEDFDDEDEDGDAFGGSDSEGDGDFEDLENPTNTEADPAGKEQSLQEERDKNARRKEEFKQRFEEEDRAGFANDKAIARRETGAGADEFGEDEWYDAQKAKIQKQLDINRSEFEAMDDRARVRTEGYKAGTYARIVFTNVPYEFAAHFTPRFPLIIGGLTQTESRYGFVQVRIKRHRWHSKILKNNDPLIFSLGWRRFQTIPVYSISDSRTRNRMLKYTPEHMHCFGTFYGPLCAPNTGFCAVQSLSTKAPGFRIAATGVVLNVDESTEIVKKLKLKGFPHKIFKNTAILRDMFNSDLEIAKFKAAQLRTVSGVRGMVKGSAGRQFPDGYIRAGFEDKILKSDIVYLSAWRTVHPRRFCMPVTNLLTDPSIANAQKNAWTSGMRTTGTLRFENGIPVPGNRDSNYRPVERPDRHFNALNVPRKLAADLPFKSQIRAMKPQRNETYMAKRAVVAGGEEKKARDLMQKLLTLRKEKVQKRAEAQEKRKEPHRRRVAEDLEKKTAREKREREEYWKREGRKRKNQEDGGSGGGRGAKKARA